MSPWNNAGGVEPRRFTCGFCGTLVGAHIGFHHRSTQGLDEGVRIYVCSYCDAPTLFDEFGNQFPSPRHGADVRGLPDDVEALYNEARNALQAPAPTAAVLVCRKILAHVGVAQEAEENRSFAYYVEYLADKGYVPPNGRRWVDHIRDKGNEANHEIVLMSTAEAEQLLTFVQMLLTFMYELPAAIPEIEAPPDAP